MPKSCMGTQARGIKKADRGDRLLIAVQLWLVALIEALRLIQLIIKLIR